MPGESNNPIALVTGATQGIGRAIALALTGANFDVAVLARTARDVEATCTEIARRGRRALPLVADVTDRAQVSRAFETVITEFSAVDLLVNNAGRGIRKPFADTSADDWDYLINLNLGSMLCCTEAALRHMLPRGRGTIINVASRAGRRPEAGFALYSALKSGVVAFTQALAQEVGAQGIRVAAVCPGPVDTVRLRREVPDADRSGWLTPEDVAQAVVFLSSPAATRYNGAILDLFS
jgi:3-oxoacyl-[acyl-carrier protein] reductase